MGKSCNDNEFWDSLLRHCVHCETACRQTYVSPKCTRYCDAAKCKVRPGYLYDSLLKKCISCTEICGRHTPQCSQYCSTPPPPMTTKLLLTELASRTSNSRGPTVLGESATLLYSLLAVCMVLLLTSLSLTLGVLLRGCKAKTSDPGPTVEAGNHRQKREVQPGQEVGFPGCQLGDNSKGFPTNPNCPTTREPSDDSIPTETCVCVHCFPDLKALGQGWDRSPRAPYSYQPAVLHRAQIQNGGRLWTAENLHTPGLQVQEEAAVG